MPVKDQTLSYRTFDGVKWFNLCDVLEDQQERDVMAAQDAGVRIRFRKHPEGFQRAYYHPEDEDKLTAALRPE